jgi:periplasmic protein TonB
MARPNRHAALWGAAVALMLHALLAIGLVLVPHRGWQAERVISLEIDVVPPPPEPLPPPPEPPPPRLDPVPRLVPHKVAMRMPPSMPNQETAQAPSEEPVQAVFGVTQDSVVAGDSSVAVPVGNTLMTKDRTRAKTPTLPLPTAPPAPEFAPVDEDAVAEFPDAVVKPEPNYPELARRMGIEGKVRLRIGVDRKGNVKTVRVLEKAGYGMDEEAVRVVWQYKFKPAKRADGQPVDTVIPYNFTFRAK